MKEKKKDTNVKDKSLNKTKQCHKKKATHIHVEL